MRVERLEESHSCRGVHVSVSGLAAAPGTHVSTVTSSIALSLRADVGGLTRRMRLGEYSGHVTSPLGHVTLPLLPAAGQRCHCFYCHLS